MRPFVAADAVRVPDRDYFDVVLASIESARRRVWVSTFIFDIRPPRDHEGLVLELVDALLARRAAGVDVRVLLPGVVSTPDIDVANLATGVLLVQQRVPHRRIIGDAKRRGSHAKLVLCDDFAFLGSQNWTDDGLRENIEDCVALRGEAVDMLAAEFLTLWDHAKGMPHS